MEKATCIICQNGRLLHYLDVNCRYTGEIFQLNKCSCSLIITSPRPSYSEMDKYYKFQNYLPHAKLKSNSGVLHRFFRLFSYFWKTRFIKKHSIHTKINLLDIGGGDGSFAQYAMNKINAIHVYEKNENCIKTMKNNDIYSTSNFKDLSDSKYNIITLWHSLEHIHDMDDLFNNIDRVASNNCRMIIAVPNNLASEIKFLSRRWVAWDAPRHLYHFNNKTLTLLLEKYGWKIIKSTSMKQDTLFNIYMSLKGNIIKKIIYFSFISFYAFTNQIFFNNKVSSNLIVCQRK